MSKPLRLEATKPELIFLGKNRDAQSARGDVWFSQKKCSTGFVCGQTETPLGTSFLYFQNFTSLNEFYDVTETRPTDTVTAEWPRIGYSRPSGKKPFPLRKKIQLLDSIISFGPPALEEIDRSEIFLQLLNKTYGELDKPETKAFDWYQLAEEVQEVLATSPCCFTKIEGNRYLLPYVNGGRPDSLVQLRTLAWLAQWNVWRKQPSSLREDLAKTIVNFYNRDDGYIARFPCFGDNDCGQTEKIDTWYSVYALMNLAEIAKSGDVDAHVHLMKAIAYIEKMAKKFKYDFPVFYDAHSFEVIQQSRGEASEGQTDVAGLYAWILLNITDLTGDDKHRAEAIRAIKATNTFTFNLCYQTNITAWGAAAAFRLWDEEKDEFFYKVGLAYLANFFRYCVFFEPDYGSNKDFSSFLSVMALSSCEYTAVLENADSLAAIQDIVRRCDKQLPEWLGNLCCEFCKYSLNHCKYYFPQNLPTDALETQPREGHIDPNMPIPVEDLYVCGEQKAGKVGQEIYGAGSAFALCAAAFVELKINGGMVSCEYPFDLTEEKGFVELKIYGREVGRCSIDLWRLPDKIKQVRFQTGNGSKQKAVVGGKARMVVSGGSSVRITF
jgi:hypothetical protein